MNKSAYSIKDIIEYSVFRFFLILFNLLPIKISRKIGSRIFLFFGKLSKYHLIAIQNCKIVFPDLKKKEINSIINKSWENLGQTIFELIKLKALFEDKKLIKVIGNENIKEIKNRNIPSIFISIHHSNWEIAVPLLDRLGIHTGAIYRHINNSLIDKLIYQKRNASLISKNSFYTPKGKKSAKDIIEGIKINKSIFLLIDQKDSAGEKISLFGKNAKTQIGFLKIARKYNMPIIPMQNQRLENGKFEITFHKPIYNNNKAISDKTTMLNIHKMIEKWIKSKPDQWFWQHNRFN